MLITLNMTQSKWF